MPDPADRRRADTSSKPSNSATLLADDAAWRRPMLGVLAIGCFLGLLVVVPARGWNTAMTSGLIRVGTVLAAAWFAWPKIETLTWASVRKGGFVVLVAAIVLSALRPRVFVPAFLVLFVLTWWRKRSQAKREARATSTPPRA